MTSLADELLGATHSALLATLLLRPDEALHVRELARITGVSPGTLHRELRALARLGLLKRKEVGRQVFYSADRTSPIFVELAGLLRKTAGAAQVLREALAPLSERIEVAFVFGSTAAGVEKPHSDIDVLVVGSVTFSTVVRTLHPTQERLGRDVNAVVMKPEEFVLKRRERDAFLASVIKQPKIWLIGNEDELRKLAQDRPA